MMSIEQLVEKIKEFSTMYGYESPVPATPSEISTLKHEFSVAYHMALPQSFCELLSFSNGIIFNGLTLWPTRVYGHFHESLLDANENLRASFDDQFIYFGMMDEELYVYDTLKKYYKAIEFVGKAEWQTFPDCESMIKFMLERAIE